MEYVSYLRVSSASQGIDGNGIEAQRKAVYDFARNEGSTVIREFVEEESGADDDRPVLKMALVHAQLSGAILLVKTLDRISRDLHFITALEKSEVAFRIVDMPTADSFTLHIYGALGQRERELISVRTRAALWSLKTRGITKKGLPYVAGKVENFSDAGRAKGAEASAKVRSNKAGEHNRLIAPMINAYRGKGMSFAVVADRLNQENLKTRRGGKWSAMAVKRVFDSL